VRPVLVCLTALVAACAHGSGQGQDRDAAPGTPDAPAGGPDAPPGRPDAALSDAPPGTPDAAPGTPDAGPDAGQIATGDALELSEIQLAPTGGEFVEIVNPTDHTIALDGYRLSDNGSYFLLPAGGQALDTGDFIGHFPTGATIASGQVVTVSTDTAASFTATNGVAPTYSIADGTLPLDDSSGTPGLTNTGEMVVLFYWNGQSDLVTDVDLMIAGNPSLANGIIPKSMVPVDGPDGDSIPSLYATDADTIAAQGSTPGSGKSTKRILPETGHETQGGGGNGLGGDDETSEDTQTTWDASGFSAPTPGTVPAALIP
jgi:Lamin Tail Domain